MYVGKNLRPGIILQFSWKSIAVFCVYSVAIVYVLNNFLPRFNGLPFAIVSVTGIAVAFYVGFKNNSSYERLWEARKLWGSYVNSSRTFAIYILDFIQPCEEVDEKKTQEMKKRMIRRHIAYINAVRTQLRKSTIWKMEEVGNKIVSSNTNFTTAVLDEELRSYLPEDEVDDVTRTNNPAVHINRLQSKDLRHLRRTGCIGEYEYVEICKCLAEFYNLQGSCERLKGYPFPRQYAHYSKLFVYVLLFILPFSIFSELSKLNENTVWLTVPISVVLSWIFYTMEIVGDSSENPFENSINDIPMTAICRNIEIDLLQMLKEKEIPDKIRAENNILM